MTDYKQARFNISCPYAYIVEKEFKTSKRGSPYLLLKLGCYTGMNADYDNFLCYPQTACYYDCANLNVHDLISVRGYVSYYQKEEYKYPIKSFIITEIEILESSEENKADTSEDIPF